MRHPIDRSAALMAALALLAGPAQAQTMGDKPPRSPGTGGH